VKSRKDRKKEFPEMPRQINTTAAINRFDF